MADTLISFIIPVWNLWEMTSACLHSLAACTDMDRVEVLVVDNGSTDATAQELAPLGAALFGSRFRAIRFAQNRGFAAASNEGARQAQGDCVFFLNNDTLLTPGWLPPLLLALTAGRATGAEPVGAVGPLLLYENGEQVQHCGVAFSYGGVQHLYAQFPADHPVVHQPRRLQAITAAALLMPKELFARVGMFHEGYRNGFEDMELCLRILQAGCSLHCEPRSCIIHRESQTPGRKDHESANARLFIERCPQGFARDLYAFAQADGFSVCLSDTLEHCLCLHPGEEAALNRAHRDTDDAGVLWAELHRTPLWQGGYDLMARALMKQRRWPQLAFVRTLQCNFFPDAAHFIGLEEAAALAGDMALHAQASAGTVRHNQRTAQPGELLRKAKTQCSWAQRDGKPEVEAMYLDWLRRHGG